jgi:predicted site-specific integrase-resolvase
MTAPIRAASVYLRVSTEEQELEWQEAIVAAARRASYYLPPVYRERPSGARRYRPELIRMVEDLQPDELAVAEKIDRISRLPLLKAMLGEAGERTASGLWRLVGKPVDLFEPQECADCFRSCGYDPD